jgi:ribosomal protein L23
MDKEIKHKILTTEKIFSLRSQNKVVIETPCWINKIELVKFIEAKYNTKVLKVNSLIQSGKTKFRKKLKVTLPDKKKFYLTVGNMGNFEKMDNNDA